MFVSEMQLHRQFQNPPAESHGLGSTSTPDLSLQQNVSASSPDLYLGHNQPPRPHRPLPPVESYSEEGYNNQQVLGFVLFTQNSRSNVIEKQLVEWHACLLNG